MFTTNDFHYHFPYNFAFCPFWVALRYNGGGGFLPPTTLSIFENQGLKWTKWLVETRGLAKSGTFLPRPLCPFLKIMVTFYRNLPLPLCPLLKIRGWNGQSGKEWPAPLPLRKGGHKGTLDPQYTHSTWSVHFCKQKEMWPRKIIRSILSGIDGMSLIQV